MKRDEFGVQHLEFFSDHLLGWFYFRRTMPKITVDLHFLALFGSISTVLGPILGGLSPKPTAPVPSGPYFLPTSF